MSTICIVQKFLAVDYDREFESLVGRSILKLVLKGVL